MATKQLTPVTVRSDLVGPASGDTYQAEVLKLRPGGTSEVSLGLPPGCASDIPKLPGVRQPHWLVGTKLPGKQGGAMKQRRRPTRERAGPTATVVPLRLAQHEGEKLVSRSQAKRVARRFEKFRHVVLDFEGVAQIGQAFADELFRVFALEHPTVRLTPINTSPLVGQMISRVMTNRDSSN